jgi:hypothetical protein
MVRMIVSPRSSYSFASVIALKAANDYYFKTGQTEGGPEHSCFYLVIPYLCKSNL